MSCPASPVAKQGCGDGHRLPLPGVICCGVIPSVAFFLLCHPERSEAESKDLAAAYNLLPPRFLFPVV